MNSELRPSRRSRAKRKTARPKAQVSIRAKSNRAARDDFERKITDTALGEAEAHHGAAAATRTKSPRPSLSNEIPITTLGQSSAVVENPRFHEIQLSFKSLETWNAWSEGHPELRIRSYIDDMARSIQLTGFLDPLVGFVHPSEVTSAGDNYREGFGAHGLNSRNRAMMLPLLQHTLMNGRCCTIYLSEHVSSFSEAVTRRFPYVITSEYIPSPAVRRRQFQIRHEDPLRLTLPDHAFDLYLSSDRMMYAPSLMDYLREARRILRRTGQLIATFPFRYGEQFTELRAHIRKGEIAHLLPPEYHDDALESGEKNLVFFVPGWDIIEAAREAGFSTAEIIAISSRTHAILGAEIATIFVLRAVA